MTSLKRGISRGWDKVSPSELRFPGTGAPCCPQAELLETSLILNVPPRATEGPGRTFTPSQIWGSPGLRCLYPSKCELPEGRGRVLSSESQLHWTGAVSWTPSAWVGEGAAGPEALPSGGRGPPMRPCPLCDTLEVSGDQDSQSWVQGAA